MWQEFCIFYIFLYLYILMFIFADWKISHYHYVNSKNPLPIYIYENKYIAKNTLQIAKTRWQPTLLKINKN